MPTRRALFCALAAVLFVQAAGVRVLAVSGNSMAPLIRNGDVVLIARAWSGGNVGEIVLVQRPSDGELLLHRVIDRDRGWRTTKGDASSSPDSERIPETKLLGGLALVIPTGLLGSLPINGVLAQFTDARTTGLVITSAPGARAQIEAPLLLGGDAAGQLLPGGSATWSLTLSPCPLGLAGECAGSTSTLRIDPTRFPEIAASGIARSLRISTRCRALGGSSWTTSADLFTSAWSAANPLTGRLASLTHGSPPQECQVSVTLLGSLAAASSAMQLPLRWGPE
jgi:signal peptidase I